MKYVIIMPDGAAGEPLDALGGKTSLQAADLPTLDALAAQGRLGTAATTTDGSPPGKVAALLGVLGYNPERYSAGEGATIASLRGIGVESADQVFCCNLVTVIDGTLRDFTAGFVSDAEAAPLVDALNAAFNAQGFEFRHCGGHRNICVWHGAGDVKGLQTTPPDRIVQQPIKRHMPPGSGSRPLFDLMMAAEALLRDHDVNLVRQDLGEDPANAIWLWGHGPLPALPSFSERFGVQGGLVAGDDVVRGLGRLIGWTSLEPTGATGLPDTDYAAKGRAAVAALETHELVCVHVEAPNVLGTLGNVEGKVNALEMIDRQIVAPVVARLRTEGSWRLLVIAPRPDGLVRDAEVAGRAQFVLAGDGIETHRGDAFDELDAAEGELHPDRASDLMEYFLRR